MPLAICCNSVVTCTSTWGGDGPWYGPPPPVRSSATRLALEGSGLGGSPLAAGDLVDGHQLIGAVPVLIERDLAGRTLRAVGGDVGQQRGTLVLPPGAIVAERLGQRADQRVRRVVGERTVGAVTLAVALGRVRLDKCPRAVQRV